jgi:hypothetical protein
MASKSKSALYGIRYLIHSLNNSKFFAGIIMIILNIGSKYITIKLSKSQEQYLRNAIARQLLIFAIVWTGSRDLLVSLAITAAFIVLTDHLFNEDSAFCIIPQRMRQYEKVLDLDEDGKVTPEEVNQAFRILNKMKKREQRRSHLRMVENFKSQL